MNFEQFYTETYADFRPCRTPRREPDFISASRSAYWDEGDHVIRCSDHWGRVASCWWVFDGCRRSGPTMTGMCRYADFWRRVPLTVGRRAVVIEVSGRQAEHISLSPWAGWTRRRPFVRRRSGRRRRVG